MSSDIRSQQVWDLFYPNVLEMLSYIKNGWVRQILVSKEQRKEKRKLMPWTHIHVGTAEVD